MITYYNTLYTIYCFFILCYIYDMYSDMLECYILYMI